MTLPACNEARHCDRPPLTAVRAVDHGEAGWARAPNVSSEGTQLLNGPTQYLTLNSVLMSLEYNLYHNSCYSAYAVVIIVVVIYSYRNQQ